MINIKRRNKIEIITYFHPIISIKDRSIVALEALSRFKTKKDETLRPISHLINTIKTQKELLKLDIQLINQTADSFNKSKIYNDEILLFINISSAIVNKGAVGAYVIDKILKDKDICSRRVVLEILEENLDESENLTNFFDICRELNYSIALDDVGVGYSNLQRIAQVKPDIIKLDISLITNIHNDFYKRKVFKSLTRLAHDIGSLVVAEGVETEDETLTALQLGAGLVQGFYFCKPDNSTETVFEICSPKIEHCRVRLKERIREKQLDIQIKIKIHNKTVEDLAIELSITPFNNIKEVLFKHLKSTRDMDCIFVLDKEGIQVSETVTLCDDFENRHFLFHPASIGADHSLKPYFIEPNPLNDLLVTERYISQATGQSCRTYSRYFYNNNKLYILCVDYTDNSNFINQDFINANLETSNSI